MLLESQYRLFDLFGVGKHRQAEGGQPVAGRMAYDERPAELRLEYVEATVDGGLADGYGPRCGKRTALPRHREKVTKVTPVDHQAVMHP